MQIKKLISGAQTGADRAALDFAIEYDIAHGGWVPRGRLAEDGLVPARYNVQELASGGYPERTEQNAKEADGTLIISHGELTGGSLLTWQVAEKHGKPVLHVDLDDKIAFDAAIDIHEWIKANGVEVLNVAGPRASKDPRIYETTYNILETVFHIDAIAETMPDIVNRSYEFKSRAADRGIFPRSVDEAVDLLLTQLTQKEKSLIAGMSEGDLPALMDTLGRRVDAELGLGSGNEQLIADCRKYSQDAVDGAEAAAKVIMREFWVRLRQVGQIRIVK